MELSEQLLKILVCPITKTQLIYDKRRQELISPQAKVAFPVIDGIPIMLEDKARKIDDISIAEVISEQKLDHSNKVNT